MRLARRGLPVVVGTTGWDHRQAEVCLAVNDAGVGVVCAPNCSPGVNLFLAAVDRVAPMFGGRADFGAWIHEAHHAGKRDAPPHVSSTRVGSVPGTHTVGFDAVYDTITLTHTARDRATFARGALEAARWVPGRRGWFGMRDVLGLV